MPGSAGDPVRLDPAQHVVEVGWRKLYGGPVINIYGQAFFSETEECGGGAEDFTVGLHVGSFLTRTDISFGASPGEGVEIVITPLGGGAAINCTASNVTGAASRNFGDWEYSEVSSTDPVLGGVIAVSGTQARIDLTNAGALDSAPVCRNLLLGGGRVSAAWLSAGAAVTAGGATIPFAGVAYTEIGGLGRVFHPVGVSGGVDIGAPGANSWGRAFSLIVG